MILKQTDPKLYDFELVSFHKLINTDTVLSTFVDKAYACVTTESDSSRITTVFRIVDLETVLTISNPTHVINSFSYDKRIVITGLWTDHELIVNDQIIDLPGSFVLSNGCINVFHSQAYASVTAKPDNIGNVYVAGTWSGYSLYYKGNVISKSNDPTILQGFAAKLNSNAELVWSVDLVSTKYVSAMGLDVQDKLTVFGSYIGDLIQCGTHNTGHRIVSNGISGYRATYSDSGLAVQLTELDVKPKAITNDYVLSQTDTVTTISNNQWTRTIQKTLYGGQIATDIQSRVYVLTPYTQATFDSGFRLSEAKDSWLLAIYDNQGTLMLVIRLLGVTNVSFTVVDQSITLVGSYQSMAIINGKGKLICEASAPNSYIFVLTLSPYSDKITLPKGCYQSIALPVATRASTLVIPEYLFWFGKRVKSILMGNASEIQIDGFDICANTNANILLT